jgi:cysteine desulfuration protein SufE
MQTVTEAFALLDSWEQRFELIAEMGKQLIPPEDAERSDINLVPGCETRTWLTGTLDPVGGMEYRADAESPLVRGLVALLLLPYQGKTPREVLDIDPAEVFGSLRLENGLSAKRRAGMEAFLGRLRRIARACQVEPERGMQAGCPCDSCTESISTRAPPHADPAPPPIPAAGAHADGSSFEKASLCGLDFVCLELLPMSAGPHARLTGRIDKKQGKWRIESLPPRQRASPRGSIGART